MRTYNPIRAIFGLFEGIITDTICQQYVVTTYIGCAIWYSFLQGILKWKAVCCISLIRDSQTAIDNDVQVQEWYFPITFRWIVGRGTLE